MMKQNSFSHWEKYPNSRHTYCIICRKYGYDEMCKSCVKPVYTIVRTLAELNIAHKEGYKLISTHINNVVRRAGSVHEDHTTNKYFVVKLKDKKVETKQVTLDPCPTCGTSGTCIEYGSGQISSIGHNIKRPLELDYV